MITDARSNAFSVNNMCDEEEGHLVLCLISFPKGSSLAPRFKYSYVK